MTLEQAHSALRTIESSGMSVTPNPSHKYARYTTPKSSEGNFILTVLVPASESAHRRIQDQLSSLTEERLQSMLLHYETGTDDTESNPLALETLLKCYITSNAGLQWSWAHSQLTFPKTYPPAKSKEQSLLTQSVDAMKNDVDRQSSPVASEMKVDVLYYPSDPGYPFVDLLWVNEEASLGNPYPAVSSCQCSISDGHPKTLAVYEKLRARLKMPAEQLLIVYMATIPKSVASYVTGPVSTFFKGTTKRNRSGSMFEFPQNVEFRILLPHETMKNARNESNRYVEVLDQIYSMSSRSMPDSKAM
eukprot:CAMPEP_0194035608 /NCGR_PEP_ID=MMETSP0009_2-20130614/8019_1 /TAXON_ID=210454 /ORGANISM="Grammatophora oceanica, Strain CCMP 410" /LENGTH=303 /DNA_ID=CAMNT_0038677025 /DNA_START=138 /DNA_END=1049 /DNA_ORIENTATION=+